MSRRNDFDVAILGGGLAGLTAALQLGDERPATRIAVVEKRSHPVPDTAHKVGESVAEVAAIYLKDMLGLEDYLAEHQHRKMGLRWFCSNGDNRDISERVEFVSRVELEKGVSAHPLTLQCRKSLAIDSKPLPA